uniref:TPS42 n=1 Tax=Juglans sigillata TaxID=224355 RepID=A0A8K1B0N8_9ROSI|nr:TPS42 [Juglans sigillata]
MEEARNFATKHLKEYVNQNNDQNLCARVNHALELPLHWRMPWLEARRVLTKVNALITTIDDVYDVYGTLYELELFTDAVERWDANATEKLPYYMQTCFLSLHNAINEMAFETLKEKGFNNIRSLEEKWYYNGYTPSFQEYIENAWVSISAPAILVHAYFAVTNRITKESCDFLDQEYPNIIRWSSMILRLMDDLGTSTDELERGDVPKSIQCYMNDTSCVSEEDARDRVHKVSHKDELERGDVPKSIQCYMNDTGVSEEDAREYIRSLIRATWKKFNKERTVTSPFSETYIEVAMNLARMAQCMYQYGDGHGSAESETKDRVLALLIHPIPLPKNIDG